MHSLPLLHLGQLFYGLAIKGSKEGCTKDYKNLLVLSSVAFDDFS